jgi:hypothetical protein
MIAGSRHASQKLLAAVHVAIEVAQQEHLDIIVGDNPLGVDAKAIGLALTAGLSVTIYGTNPNPRIAVPVYPLMENCHYKRVLYENFLDNDPLWEWKALRQRDRALCMDAAHGYFYWNGSSQGTKAGYTYMGNVLRRPCFLIQYAHDEKVVSKNGEFPARRL